MKIEKLSKKTAYSLKEMGFENLTEVQKKVIPYILEGKEVICRSKTGTGRKKQQIIPPCFYPN